MSQTRIGLIKVPEITALFWIIKVLSTGMGEVTSDYVVRTIYPVLAVALGGAAFVIALVLQLRIGRYVPWIYWLAVVMVAVFGTMVADVLHVRFGIPYLVTTVFFAAALLVIFVTWYATEKTLSIHTIYAGRREAFYWATVMATFALGTAVGDLTAIAWHLGFFSAGLLFAALIVVPALGFGLFHMNAILAFWWAYVLTRPLGATFADWIGRPRSLSGLGLGTGLVSLVLTVLIVVLVGYLTFSDRRAVALNPSA